MCFANRLKNLMDTLDLTQNAMGKLIRVTPPSVSRLLSGRNRPSLPVLQALVTACGVSAEWLLLGNGNMFARAHEGVVAEPEQAFDSPEDWYAVRGQHMEPLVRAGDHVLVRHGRTWQDVIGRTAAIEQDGGIMLYRVESRGALWLLSPLALLCSVLARENVDDLHLLGEAVELRRLL